MHDPVISIRGLGKQYRIGAHLLAYRRLRDLVGSLMRPGRATTERPGGYFWALRDITFDVRPGETVGIIGRNGAGKSTLLKILSQITEPTEGEAHLYGRVASLLEVGSGFHGDLSGRENIFLNGAMLGMTRLEIRKKFDEIVAFAEVEDFLDMPVKRYSSGMYVRLAFAVAAHLEPDVLIVDEVLSVGDAAFQRKCLGKMEDIRHLGRAILMVSHNMSTVSNLCERVIWLSGGKIAGNGPSSSIIPRYLSEGVSDGLSWRPDWDRPRIFEYRAVAIDAAVGQESDAIPADQPIRIRLEFEIREELPPGKITMRVSTEDGRVVFTTASTDGGEAVNARWAIGTTKLCCTIPGHFLAPGQYFISVSDPADGQNGLHENVLTFTVSEQHSLVVRDGRAGIVAPLLKWDNI